MDADRLRTIPDRRTAADAFTLVEVMVVVALMAALATMIAPRLGSATGARQVREAARRLATTARYARDYALTRRCRCRLALAADGTGYALMRSGGEAGGEGDFIPLRRGPCRRESFEGGVRLGRLRVEPVRARQMQMETPHAITFDELGQADAAVVELTDGRCTYAVVVTAFTGKVRVVDRPVTEIPNDRVDLDG